MCHASGVLDERLDGAERLRQREELRVAHDGERRVLSGSQREAHHAAEVPHLPRGGRMRVVGKLWIQHTVDRGMSDEQVDDGTGVRAVTVHAHGEGLQAPKHE